MHVLLLTYMRKENRILANPKWLAAKCQMPLDLTQIWSQTLQLASVKAAAEPRVTWGK